ncbi:PaaI family thioesterase [Halogranum rubrum]|uniref:Phenylacetic acid degradation protein PaaI n=1 Tax=Halogranum salarium B-1 TaxID=1210908 RepID=J3JCZ1_9EURY|nr:hotdog fold thioesterase [Halogranum salarium]EJN57034.1 phenylacetic acid degradation protein PaaI [Halogranum salarium B-1]
MSDPRDGDSSDSEEVRTHEAGPTTNAETPTPVAPAVRERIESDPYCATLGIELRRLESGSATTALTVTDDLVNFHGTPHGGAIYSLADAAFAAASNSHGETAVALETNISYLSAVEVGSTILATATETHLTRRTGEYEVVLTTESDGERLATFRGRVYRP